MKYILTHKCKKKHVGQYSYITDRCWQRQLRFRTLLYCYDCGEENECERNDRIHIRLLKSFEWRLRLSDPPRIIHQFLHTASTTKFLLLFSLPIQIYISRCITHGKGVLDWTWCEIGGKNFISYKISLIDLTLDSLSFHIKLPIGRDFRCFADTSFWEMKSFRRGPAPVLE